MNGSTFRDGVFSLFTYRFGCVTELLVQQLAGLQKSESRHYDLYDDLTGDRVEVKFSRALRSHDESITMDNVVSVVEDASSPDRVISVEDKDALFDCNMQALKRSEFDVLFYGICFAECVVVFKIRSSDIASSSIGYSDKQQKGITGTGQFHVSNSNFQDHLERFHYATLTWDEVRSLLLK